MSNGNAQWKLKRLRLDRPRVFVSACLFQIHEPNNPDVRRCLVSNFSDGHLGDCQKWSGGHGWWAKAQIWGLNKSKRSISHDNFKNAKYRKLRTYFPIDILLIH